MSHKDELVAYPQLEDDDSSESSEETQYPSLTQQIALDLNSVTRQISGLELREGNRIAKKADLVNQL